MTEKLFGLEASRLFANPFTECDEAIGPQLDTHHPDLAPGRKRLLLNMLHVGAAERRQTIADLVVAGLWTVPPYVARLRPLLGDQRFRRFMQLRLKLLRGRTDRVWLSVWAAILHGYKPTGTKGKYVTFRQEAWSEADVAAVAARACLPIERERRSYVPPGDRIVGALFETMAVVSARQAGK